MGILLAKFRKEKSTQDILENLQDKIDTLEVFTLDTQEQKKRVSANFLTTSIGLYIIAFVVFYFLYFPPTWRERIIYFIPLILFPFVIMLLRRLFAWYYQRKLNKSSKELTALRAEKKKILEKVMDKETYKVAVALLAKYGDKPSTSRTQYSALNSTPRTPIKSNLLALNRSLPAPLNPIGKTTTAMTLTPTLMSSGRSQQQQQMSMTTTTTTPTMNFSTPRTTISPMVNSPANNSSNQLLRRRTPFPVIDQKAKGVFEKIVDVLVGDGPGDRFAMICKECFAHNGMALKEDFEYTTFRCAFCNALNPARKARPAAPRLSHMPAQNADDSSSDEKDDSDDELSPINATQAKQFPNPLIATGRNENTTSSSSDEEQNALPGGTTNTTEGIHNNDEENKESEIKADDEHLLPTEKTENILEKSDSAIDDVSMSNEEH